ncbi:MAG: DUF362 domain-containing protein, partial [Proteobacteria bacterium]|nr:DUF362 domain-containing protein [Pseudomonadota bacterium]
LYGNWFLNRSVVQVAARAGYLDENLTLEYQGEDRHFIHVQGEGVNARVPLVDLTLDTRMADLGPGVGEIEVGKAWVDADFRLNCAKMKSHFFSWYTMAIKNVYGCLPLQDKVRGYHCKRAVGSWTAALIHRFPVHFSLVDGYTAADGWLGVKMKAICAKCHTLIAGADIQAVDHLGASLMGLSPEKSIMYTNLARLTPPRPYQVVGNAQPFAPWKNVHWFLVVFSEIIERYAHIMDFAGSLATGGYDACFPHKSGARGPLKKLLYFLTVPVNAILDAGNIHLSLRRRKFLSRLKRRKRDVPLLAASSFLASRLEYLSPADTLSLAGILEEHPGEKAAFSGHYILMNGREIPFPARLTTSNHAAVDILNLAAEDSRFPAQLATELRKLPHVLPGFFGPDQDYPFCFR